MNFTIFVLFFFQADDGMTVLHYAAKAGHNNVIKILLDTGDIDVNIQVSYLGNDLNLSDKNPAGHR